MPETVDQQIINALKARLQSITIANGYNYDLGSKVFEWRTADIAISDLPALSYKDLSCESEHIEMGQRHRMYIEIELFVAAAATTSASLRKMRADIKKAIGVDPQFGGLAIYTYLQGEEMDIEQADKTVGSAKVKIIILHRTKEWNPYEKL